MFITIFAIKLENLFHFASVIQTVEMITGMIPRSLRTKLATLTVRKFNNLQNSG